MTIQSKRTKVKGKIQMHLGGLKKGKKVMMKILMTGWKMKIMISWKRTWVGKLRGRLVSFSILLKPNID
jgi:hypothetical protein